MSFIYCQNERCTRARGKKRARVTGGRKYCTMRCAGAVRSRRLYHRQKQDIVMVPCEHCHGSGKIPTKPTVGKN